MSTKPTTRTIKETRALPVLLTEDEVHTAAKQCADEVNDRAKTEAEKSAVMKQFGARLKEHERSISRLTDMVRTEKETRDVEVEVTMDYAAGRVTAVRKDTGENVEDRPMLPHERQLARL